MSKGKRNREIRKLAYAISASNAKSVARALRRHGRMPLPKRAGQR